MTSKDKPTRPGGKAKGRDTKPHSGGEKAAVRAAGSAPAASAAGAEQPQRISKILSRAGVASRRDVERMIMEGRVSLNGLVLDTPVVNATLADRIEVDGHPIRGIERTRLWLYHKPGGLVTTNADPEGRPTVFENLPEDLPRVLSIGRLDINTEGLLLLTNDGGLARVLELPSTGWLRRYRVRAHGEIDQAALDRLKEGIAVEGVLYGAIEATLDRVQGSNVWITMGLREGKNREIKNVLGALGLDVNRLIRISYGPFQLGELPIDQVQEIRGRTLREQLGPRLIADAKANFDAPIYNDQSTAAEPEAEPVADRGKAEWGSKREKAGDKRERALARLDTRRDDGRPNDRGRSRGKAEERPARPPLRRNRSSNVWMAPGARPTVEKKPKAAEDELSPKSTRRAPADVKRRDRAKDPATAKAAGFDEERKGKAGKSAGRKDAAGGFERRRPLEGAERKSRDHGDRPPRRPEGERAARDPADDRASSGGRKETARPPRGDGKKRFADDRPRANAGGKPAAANPSANRSSESRAGKPAGTKPSGGRRPGGGKPGNRPGGGKPGNRPGGGKSSGKGPQGRGK
ncbi:pseudouridine synthase [Sinorhizobium medicae]|uniref:pseudouridine synthase n=1 Tax=Sinorhizobium medicae TaxID=110321 RepID=UPI002AF6CC98|nr:pseudouridine synthase [Sinorhizobium medicae]WQO46306.1 pseudouridine synthase [Sinorhizobium medicae]WQO73557.1 pseudouridine synthase [Sinorhizobium medicae]WQO92900.1 pseudouridine synthase [Sinorhizobium medicae]